MKERDTIQIFDYALASETVRLDREGLWDFIVPRIELIRSLPSRLSMFILPASSPRHPRAAFDEFFDEDPADVKQPLINDLCYRGPRMRVSYFARCGYLDSHLSVPVGAGEFALSSEDVLPWDDDSEAWYWAGRFDILAARHVGLMITSLQKHREDYIPIEPPAAGRSVSYETPADFEAELDFLTSVHYQLITDPTLRAVYSYQV